MCNNHRTSPSLLPRDPLTFPHSTRSTTSLSPLFPALIRPSSLPSSHCRLAEQLPPPSVGVIALMTGLEMATGIPGGSVGSALPVTRGQEPTVRDKTPSRGTIGCKTKLEGGLQGAVVGATHVGAVLAARVVGLREGVGHRPRALLLEAERVVAFGDADVAPVRTGLQPAALQGSDIRWGAGHKMGRGFRSNSGTFRPSTRPTSS